MSFIKLGGAQKLLDLTACIRLIKWLQFIGLAALWPVGKETRI
jgi:hypothetical protein